MRIQHNIMAMNAYRNYNSNTSALSKNLEKLSSGYKINRAGDDAAGLAISEKMRAQITGLNAASKNVKDGISLVKTAEGAMQEIQDMLNRMDYLATQSANGTYDNEVDRAALQKEVDQLKSEINRIADSANFNGIKLLNGSLDRSAVTGVDYNKVSADDIAAMLPADMSGKNQPDVDQVGNVGALETDGSNAPSKNSFQVSLDGVSVEVTGDGAQTFTLNIGDQKMEVELSKGKYSGAQLAAKLAEKYGETGIQLGGQNQTFTVKTDGNVLKFSNNEKADAELDASAKVSWTLGEGGAETEAPVTVTDPADTAVAFTDGQAGAQSATLTFDLAGFDVDKAGTVSVTIGGKIYDVEITEDEFADKDTNSLDSVLATKLADAMNADKLTDIAGGAGVFTAAVNGTEITLTSADKAPVADNGLKGINSFTVEAKAVEENDGAGNANALIAPHAGEATEGTPASLTVGVAIDGNLNPAQNDTITFESGGNTKLNLTFKYEGQDWALDGATAPDGYEATFDGTSLTLTATENGKVDANPFGTVSVKEINIDSSTDASKVTLTQDTDAWAPGTDAVQGGDNEGDGEGDNAETEVVASGKISVATVDLGAGKDDQLDAAAVSDLKDAFKAGGSMEKITVGDVEVDLTGVADNLTGGTSTVGDLAKAILDKANAAVTAWNEANGEKKGYTYANVRISTTPDGGNVMQLAAGDGLYVVADKIPAEEGAGNTNATTNGYINTGIQNVTNYDAGSKPQLANAAVDFGAAGAWQDGAQITIGDTTYTVAVGADSKFKDVKNVIDLTDQTAGAVDAKTAAKRLTAAAANNGIFTVGHDGTGKTTLQQKSSVKDTTDMTTKEKFASYLGISTPDSIDGAVAGKGLTLQIGDTSDSYNQLKVSIGDMHTSALGIADLNIGNQADAAAAIQTIRNAINYVSGVRGDLGATQNRLEHTGNNLSVMAENIQDAESTIRDTDVAEEMMSYVKNNILVQSAQAMLAQANQVPQGVLQLLG